MNVSEAYALAIGLHNAALDHKRTCHENCNVSLGDFRRAATRIMGDTSRPWPVCASPGEMVHFKRLEWPF